MGGQISLFSTLRVLQPLAAPAQPGRKALPVGLIPEDGPPLV
jgi:hypothetical protein